MSRLHDEWKVDAHGALEHLGDGVWTVAGEISSRWAISRGA